MIKLFSLKQQKKEEESAGGTKGTSKKASAAQLRIQKGVCVWGGGEGEGVPVWPQCGPGAGPSMVSRWGVR